MAGSYVLCQKVGGNLDLDWYNPEREMISQFRSQWIEFEQNA